MPDSEKIAAIRQMLPATGAGIYLNAGTCGPLPAETMRAMDEQAASELAVGRAKIDQFVAFMDRMAEARASVAALLVADPDDIALTHSTTDGINLVLSSLPWAPGDRVVTTNHEHPGVLGPLQALRDRHGVEVEFVDIGDGGDAELTLAGIRRALERPARAVVASHVLWTTGAVLPVGALGTLAREAGAVSVIDGAQSAGAIPVALDELGVDAYAVPGQKWLLGPEGMGALWVRRAFADATIPAIAGYLAYSSFDRDKGGTLREGARRFEATGFHRPSVIGLARSVRLADDVRRAARGRWSGPRASPHRRTRASPRSRACAWSRPATTAARSSRSASTAGRPPRPSAELGPRVFAIIRDLPPIDAIRISVGFWNTEEELERFAAAVELLAGHTPETIPPRRTLTVLGSDDQPLA